MNERVLSDYDDFYRVCHGVFETLHERAGGSKGDAKHKFVSQWLRYYDAAVRGVAPGADDFLDFMRVSIHEILAHITKFADMEEQRPWFKSDGIPAMKDAFLPLLEPLGNDIFPSFPRKAVPYSEQTAAQYGQPKEEMLSAINAALEKPAEKKAPAS